VSVSARRLPVDQRRAKLLALGLELFATRSYDDVAIEHIAAAAGVSKGLLYHYFAGKRVFFVAVVEQACEQLKAATEPDRSLPPDLQLANSLDGFLRFVEDHASGWSWLLRGGGGNDAELVALRDGVRDVVVRRVLDVVATADPPSPILIAAVRGWVGFNEASALSWLEDNRAIPREVMVTLMSHALTGALAAVARVDATAVMRPFDSTRTS
jgi:AcrR family transcriptional regulator